MPIVVAFLRPKSAPGLLPRLMRSLNAFGEQPWLTSLRRRPINSLPSAFLWHTAGTDGVICRPTLISI